MSIIKEKKYFVEDFATIKDALKKIAEDWGKPYEEIDGTDSDKKLKIYIDQAQDIFLIFYLPYKTGYGMQVYFCHGNNEQEVIYDTSNNNRYIFTDGNSDGNVLYFRSEYTPTGSGNSLIIAKDQSGDWACFTADKMVTVNGTFNLGTVAVPVGNNLLYSAFLMPNPDNGQTFTQLYKMFTARSKSRENLYVAFGNKPYRVVSTNILTSSNTLANNPSYAFEARQD